ncbi:MAG: sigma-54 dependent transcriptional regulator [bacterium]
METRILVVDDDNNIRKSIKGFLEDKGYFVETVSTGEEAISLVKKSDFDIILLDIVLPGMDGLQALEKIRQDKPRVPVIIVSGQATIDNAIQATKLGAYDFIEKPIMGDKLLLLIAHLIENEEFKRQSARRYIMIGKSPAMENLCEEIEKSAPSNARILIQGESGVGKELVAHSIHQHSSRNLHPFIAVNCAALPKELIESELFGYEKGAFTGAVSRKEGKFLLANNGTLFLDEIGDMSLETQAKLLRALEEGEIEPLGGKNPTKVDVRVISATNKNLRNEVDKGNFRQDLLFRINVIPIFVPPLRKRTEDIDILAEHFLKVFCEENGKKVKIIEQDAVKRLKEYTWPGNVRELKNYIERLVIMVPSNTITVKNVESFLPISVQKTGKNLSFQQKMDDFEKTLIEQSLIKANWNVTKAAELLKTDRPNLYRKIRKYGLLEE